MVSKASHPKLVGEKFKLTFLFSLFSLLTKPLNQKPWEFPPRSLPFFLLLPPSLPMLLPLLSPYPAGASFSLYLAETCSSFCIVGACPSLILYYLPLNIDLLDLLHCLPCYPSCTWPNFLWIKGRRF